MRGIYQNDVVQINPICGGFYGGCFMTVSSVEDNYVIGTVQVPEGGGEEVPTSKPVNVKIDRKMVEKVGECVWRMYSPLINGDKV